MRDARFLAEIAKKVMQIWVNYSDVWKIHCHSFCFSVARVTEQLLGFKVFQEKNWIPRNSGTSVGTSKCRKSFEIFYICYHWFSFVILRMTSWFDKLHFVVCMFFSSNSLTPPPILFILSFIASLSSKKTHQNDNSVIGPPEVHNNRPSLKILVNGSNWNYFQLDFISTFVQLFY